MNNSGTIGWAIDTLRTGASVRRYSWSAERQWLKIEGDRRPQICLKSRGFGSTPWLCTQADLMAKDWELVEG